MTQRATDTFLGQAEQESPTAVHNVCGHSASSREAETRQLAYPNWRCAHQGDLPTRERVTTLSHLFRAEAETFRRP